LRRGIFSLLAISCDDGHARPNIANNKKYRTARAHTHTPLLPSSSFYNSHLQSSNKGGKIIFLNVHTHARTLRRERKNSDDRRPYSVGGGGYNFFFLITLSSAAKRKTQNRRPTREKKVRAAAAYLRHDRVQIWWTRRPIHRTLTHYGVFGTGLLLDTRWPAFYDFLMHDYVIKIIQFVIEFH
jgi:hypothetical protein